MTRVPRWLAAILFLACLALPAPADEPAQWWGDDAAQALGRASTNRAELEKALEAVPRDQRKGMAFLIVNMPERDLRSLRADFLLENVDLAYKARKQVPWGAKLPEDIFLNEILPYANLDESRDPWRKELYELCLPIVKDCKTPGEAAQKLNSTVFEKLKVRYSTERKQPHQSPKESMESGKASCTGLSILLSDACRSVAVPTRLAGTPMWSNKRGNHTWVEIWDDGWHFTGACEQDPKGLDRGWFVGDAAQAKSDVPEHAIYAASFKKTKVSFPLVWAPERKDVFAENVTERYARKAETKEGQVRVLIRVWQAGKAKRAALPISAADSGDGKQVFRGESRGETADTNDILAFDLLADHEYVLRIGDPLRVEKTFRTTKEKQQTVEIELPAEGKKGGLTKEQSEQVATAAREFFAADAEKQAAWKADAALDTLLAADEASVRAAVWDVFRSAAIHEKLRKDFEDNQVRHEKHLSPYVVREVGKKPERGWPLVIAMHGGGGAPKEVNDDQWKIMQRYYRDQPETSGYKYLALRAPNDVWNGFYDDYVPPLVVNLIRQFALFGEIDPDRVFLMGYSHGGYGAFFIGPKIADRFAAIHCSAAAPTDGTISPLTLRNTPFTFMIGENDSAYGRRERCERFDKEVQKLKDENKGEFPVTMEFEKGFGHGGLPDRDKLKEMLPQQRNAAPRHLTWELTDAVVADFFWLSVPKPVRGQSIDAAMSGNTARIKTREVKQLTLGLDGRLVSFESPLKVTLNGTTQSLTAKPGFVTLCRSMQRRGDPSLAHSCEITLECDKK